MAWDRVQRPHLILNFQNKISFLPFDVMRYFSAFLYICTNIYISLTI